MLTKQQMIVAGLVGAALIAAVVEFAPRGAAPVPAPAALSLRGKFIGPSAAEDAAAFAGLCRGIRQALISDGTKSAARITTGVHVEDLRIASAEGRFLPRSFSLDQPHVAAAAGQYLNRTVGDSGGPLTPEAKAMWAEAFLELAKAAEEAVR
ncbi:MAG: hypothetical protein EBR82_47735 [Caulobacteraceae bacterium]|nr:hypothetical protein [Caulobacteraceae bacterium]